MQELHFLPAEFVTGEPADPLRRDPLVGRMVADHLVARKIGSGGFGAVYVALQMPLFMKTALKMLKVEAGQESSSEAHQARFEKEAQALARLVHPNIVRLIKYGLYNGMPYMVMEYVGTGRDLAQELGERKRTRHGFNLAECRRIVTQVAHALEAAHNDKVVHRDIKPGNIMLQPVEGDPLFVRVLDFGLAKMVAETSESTVAMGTPIYMAPEQYFGRDIGPWTDLYATALVCFELMTGRKAFSATNSQELFLQKISADFDVTKEAGGRVLPAVLARFMRKATAKDPSDRFRTVPEFLAGVLGMFDALEQAGLKSLHPDAVDTAGETGIVSGETVAPGEAPGGAIATLTSPPLGVVGIPGMTGGPLPAGGSPDGSGPDGKKPKRWRKIVLCAAAAVFAVLIVALAFLLWPANLAETVLSSTVAGDQDMPALATLPDGRILSAWRSVREDGSTSDVFARLFSADGKPVADEFPVSSSDGTDKRAPVLASFGDGRVLAVWNSEGQDGSGMGVIGQWLTPEFARYRGEFVINADYREGDQELADVAVSGDDRCAVVWQSYGQDGDDFGIVCQLFEANGDRKGASHAVNTLTSGRQRFPAVAAGPDGRYLVVWESSLSSDQQEDYTIFGQLLDGDGGRMGPPVAMNTYTRGRQRYPDVALLPGGYVVTWTSEDQDGSGRGVFGQLLDRDLGRVGEEFRVNTFTAGDQWVPRVAALPDGRFAIVWISAGQDGSGFGVFGQIFAADAQRAGSEFQVNQYSESDQNVRSVAVLGDDRFIVSWDSRDQDGSGWGVFARVVGTEAAVGK